MKEILLCTGNQGKVKEIRGLIPEMMIVRSLKELGLGTDLLETGDTLEENAIQKALWGYQQSGLVAIADDSGLEVDALNGAPGVNSAHYAGDQRSDSANILKLLADMPSDATRAARFRTVIAYCDDNGAVTFEGVVKGSIARERRGTAGFGYDAVFVPEGSELTFAEMTLQQKQHSSHRGKAMAKLIQHLRKII